MMEGSSRFILGFALLVVSSPVAFADRYEATVTVRPVAGVGLFSENIAPGGGSSAASTYGGGGEVSMAYGLRNWLDVGAEAIAAAFTKATYDSATVAVHGISTMGRVTRTTRIAQLRAGATLRLGVAWVPVVHLGFGLGARMPTAATLRTDENARVDLTPDGMDAGMSVDLCVIARAGLEHRLDRRWSIGVSAEVAHTVGLAGLSADLLSAGVSLSYTWYPLW